MRRRCILSRPVSSVSTASKPHTLTLRPVGREASAVLTQIHAEAFSNYWNIEDFNDFFSISGTLAWLAQDGDGQALGMAVLRVQHEQADIITVAVRMPFRRLGVGRALMAQAVDKAKECGCVRLFLDVEAGNQAAISLYESMGFLHLSRRKLYYRQKDGSYTDALVMACKLA